MTLLVGTLLPMCLAMAVSPMMLSEQLVLLAGRDGRRTAGAFAVGTAVVVAAVVGLVLVVGSSLSLPRAPTLSGSLDVVLGLVLLATAVGVWRLRHHRRRRADDRAQEAARRDSARTVHGPAGGFAFGVFSMATNVTSLAIVVAATKDLAASGWSRPGLVLAGLLLIASACVPAWTPLALQAAAPTTGTRALTAVSGLLSRHGRLVVTVLLAGAGVLFVVKGVVRLV